MPGRHGPLAAALAGAALAALVAGCTSPPDPVNLTPPPQPQVIGQHEVAPTLTREIDAFFANDFADAYRTRRVVYVTVGGTPVARRYHRSAPAATYDVGAVGTAILTTLVGIAIDEHRIGGIDQTAEQLLPAYRHVMAPRMRGVTLGELLSMTAGLPTDAANAPFTPVDQVEPGDGPDLTVAGILAAGPDRPIGEFAYSLRSTVLVTEILAVAVGGQVGQYARTRLFAPLGVRPVGPGLGANLRLGAGDLARLGQLWLDGGQYAGRQVVSASWVSEMVRAQTSTGLRDTPTYGYSMWLTSAGGHDAFSASGLGGQLVEVVPDLDLVAVVQSAPDWDVLGTARTGVVGAADYTNLVDAVIAPAVH